MNAEKVLITGDGFLAYNLYLYLRNLPDVQVWNYTLHNGQDVRDYDQVREAVDCHKVVIHTAALTHVQNSLCQNRQAREEFIHVNYLGTFNVLNACRESGAKLIHVSTSEVYGSNQNQNGAPMTEGHPLNPCAGTYAAAKAAADHECRIAFECFGQNVVIARPFNLYGFAQAVEKLIPRFVHLAVSGQPLTVYGDGEQRRDYVHALDAAEALWEARSFPAGTIVNIGTERSYSVNQVAQMVKEVVERRYHKDVTIVHTRPRPNDLADLTGSYRRLNELCGWKPKRELPDGIEQTMDWYFANGPVPPPQSGLFGRGVKERRRYG